MEFPEDVLEKILAGLPVKSLLRFRCVCKRWCALIKSPSFIALHMNRSNPDCDFVLLKRDRGNPPDYKSVISFHSTQSLHLLSPNLHLPNDSVMQIVGPCNGIICIHFDFAVALCNPAIREFKFLDIRPLRHPGNKFHCPVAMGFGIDPRTGDYKVVRVISIDDDEPNFSLPQCYEVEVYNLSSNSWRVIDAHVSDGSTIIFQQRFETLFNEAVHWYVSTDRQNYILSFHLSNEVFRSISLPDASLLVEDYDLCPTVFNESLAFICYESKEYIGVPGIHTPPNMEMHFDIWVMNEYGVKESWTKLFKIGPLSGLRYPVAFLNNLELLWQSHSGQLVSCNLENLIVKNFPIHGPGRSFQALKCHETLISLK